MLETYCNLYLMIFEILSGGQMAAIAGGVAGGVAAALGSSSGESENIPTKVNNFICQVLPKLDKNSIMKREMKLCEGYCLLWHHRGLGTVNGRKTSEKLISCAYAAVILDLWAAGKVDIEVKGKLTDKCVNAVVKVMIIDSLCEIFGSHIKKFHIFF